ncbi:MAG TPA: hypothetical protein VEA40_03110 [Ramlibacter sp.]|nr:hypothetical protein [Ramlibacter sp.]
MKATPLALACALLLATAAQAQNTGRPQSGTGGYAATDSAQPSQQLDGQKGREMVRRAGDATKRAFNRVRGKANEQRQEARDDRRNDTRAMGAAPARGADTQASDAGRKARMDDAYNNWKSQQQRR